MPDKEYLTPSELEIEARAKAAINTDYGQSVLITADIPALLSTLRAERAKREELEEKYNEVMGAVGIFAVTHDEKALQKLCALADDWLNESEAPAPDPHTPGPNPLAEGEPAWKRVDGNYIDPHTPGPGGPMDKGDGC